MSKYKLHSPRTFNGKTIVEIMDEPSGTLCTGCVLAPASPNHMPCTLRYESGPHKGKYLYPCAAQNDLSNISSHWVYLSRLSTVKDKSYVNKDGIKITISSPNKGIYGVKLEMIDLHSPNKAVSAYLKSFELKMIISYLKALCL